MRTFLRFRHWQLFGVLVGIPLIIRLINSTSLRIPTEVMNAMFPAVLVLLMLIYFVWAYAIGTNLSSKIPKDVKMNFKLFKTAQLFIIFFIPIFGITTWLLMSFSPGGKPNQNIIAILGLLMCLIPFCIIYCIYFVAKTIKLVELQRPTSVKDFYADFLLILVFPLGVWIVQPRLNKISAD